MSAEIGGGAKETGQAGGRERPRRGIDRWCRGVGVGVPAVAWRRSARAAVSGGGGADESEGGLRASQSRRRRSAIRVKGWERAAGCY